MICKDAQIGRLLWSFARHFAVFRRRNVVAFAEQAVEGAGRFVSAHQCTIHSHLLIRCLFHAKFFQIAESQANYL